METKHKDQQQVKYTNGQTGDGAEPKGQDVLKADAEGAGSDAREFAEGDNESTAGEGSADESAGNDTTMGIP